MPGAVQPQARRVPCERCPLRSKPVLRDFEPHELEFVSTFKSGELDIEAGTSLFMEGANSAHVYTVLAGWAFRYKMLPDGRRQILNFALPADFLGLQGAVADEMQHSVEALTDMTLCVFPRAKLWTLFAQHPALSFDVTWLAARSEQLLDEGLLNVGRRTSLERTAYLLLNLFMRAEQIGLTSGSSVNFPFTQTHLADTLGLSLVHTNKTLKRLLATRLIRWKGKRFDVLDRNKLAEIAGYEIAQERQRPFI